MDTDEIKDRLNAYDFSFKEPSRTSPNPDPAPNPVEDRIEPTIASDAIASECTVKLLIGDMLFVTNKAKLMKYSDYFKRMFSEHWVGSIKYNDDGSIFIDKDGELFVHIIQYIRDGIFPLFYNSNGHDLLKYTRLLEHAHYFGVSGLATWLKEQKYFEAVTHKYVFEEPRRWWNANCESNSSSQVEFHTVAYTEKVYVCPRGVDVHRGRPDKCGRQCENARRASVDGKHEYEDVPVVDVLVVRKGTELKLELCWENRD